MTPDDPRHGTHAGYIAHRTEGTTACQDCKYAAAAYEMSRQHDAYFGRSRLVSALGSRRRIQALMAIGWTAESIANEIGWSDGRSIRSVIFIKERVRTSTAQRIAAAYDRLSMTRGPSEITARRSARSGYAPPLAWDDIDDPDEKPTDWQYREPTRAELLADLDDRQAGISEVCRVLAVSRDALEKWCQRHGLNATYSRMVARENEVAA